MTTSSITAQTLVIDEPQRVLTAGFQATQAQASLCKNCPFFVLLLHPFISFEQIPQHQISQCIFMGVTQLKVITKQNIYKAVNLLENHTKNLHGKVYMSFTSPYLSLELWSPFVFGLATS